jgi:hypothetical protein
MTQWRFVVAAALFAALASGCQPEKTSGDHSDSAPSRIQTAIAHGDQRVPEAHEMVDHALLTKHAIVIGVDNYQHGLRPLRHAASDARAVAAALQTDFGYAPEHVRVLIDREAERADLLQLFSEFAEGERCDPSDSLLVFFAGHGEEQKLAPSDARAGEPNTWLRVDELVGMIRRVPCHHKLLILDSCFAGTLFRSTHRRERTAGLLDPPSSPSERRLPFGAQDSLLHYLAGDAFVGLTASRLTPAIDGLGEGRHSVFTAALLDVLRRRAGSTRADRAFTFSQLAVEVESIVGNRVGARQVPDWGAIDESPGEFVFLPTSSGARRVRLLLPPGVRVAIMASNGGFRPFEGEENLEEGWTYLLRIDPGNDQDPVHALLQVVVASAREGQAGAPELTFAFTPFELWCATEGIPRTRVLCESETLDALLAYPGARRTPDDRVFIGQPPVGAAELKNPPADIDLYVTAGLNFTCRGKLFELANDCVTPESDPIGVVAQVTGGDLAAVLKLGTPDASFPGYDGMGIDAEEGASPRRYRLPLLNKTQTAAFAEQAMDRYLNERISQCGEVYATQGIGALVEQIRDVVLPELRQIATADDSLRLRAENYIKFVAHRAAASEGGEPLSRVVQVYKQLSLPVDEMVGLEIALNDFLEWLADETGQVIVVDRIAFEAYGVGVDVPVTIDEKGARALDVLDHLAADYDLGLVAGETNLEEPLTVTTSDEASAVRVTVRYYVGDLIHLDGREPFVSRVQVAFDSDLPGQVKPSRAAVKLEGDELVVKSTWRHHLAVYETLLRMRDLSDEDIAERSY